MSIKFRALLVLAALSAAPVGWAQRLDVAPDHADGLYAEGETVTWTLRYEGDDPPGEVRYTLKEGGLTEVAAGVVELVDGEGKLRASLDRPGALLAEFTVPGDDEARRLRAYGGAVVAPERIEPSAPRPDDFRSFWDDKVVELRQTPINPRLEPLGVDKPGGDYWKITMDGWDGTQIRGQLARPAGGDKLPALLIVQWAGVYPLQRSWVVDHAGEGWLVLNILAHDLPIDGPAEFYADQSRGPLNNYPAIGNDSRETSYFLRMYLSDRRAVDYLMGREDWDGETLAVMGTSQGGQQTLVTAGLCPEVTAAMALVPAGCDMLGPDVGRAPGWPMWHYQTEGRDAEAVHSASRYFDAVNFARDIACPLLVGVGHVDTVCPPEGVYAAFNQARGPKRIVPLPISGHGNERWSQRPYEKVLYGEWLPALRAGEAPPVAGRE